MTAIANQNPATTDTRITLRSAASRLEMSPLGLQKLLARTNGLIRDDGHWFVRSAVVAEIQKARAVLGLKPRAASILKAAKEGEREIIRQLDAIEGAHQ